MENNFFSGLSRTFEVYYPQVKPLVEKSEQFYNQLLINARAEVEPNRSFGNYTHASRVGKIIIREGDEGNLLPSIKFVPDSEDRKNPDFYIITTPDREPIYIGSSMPSNQVNGCSLSAMTGGLLPPSDSEQSYSLYIGLMSFAKICGHLIVYQVSVSEPMNLPFRECQHFINQYGEPIWGSAEDGMLKFAVGTICTFLSNSEEPLYPIIKFNWYSGETAAKTKKEFEIQLKRNKEIWKAVKTFRNAFKANMIDPNASALKKVNEEANPTSTKKSSGKKIEVELGEYSITINFTDREFLEEIEAGEQRAVLTDNDKKILSLISEDAMELCRPEHDNDGRDKWGVTNRTKTGKPKRPRIIHPYRDPKEYGRFEQFFTVLPEIFGTEIDGVKQVNVGNGCLSEEARKNIKYNLSSSFESMREETYIKISFKEKDAYDRNSISRLKNSLLNIFPIMENEIGFDIV